MGLGVGVAHLHALHAGRRGSTLVETLGAIGGGGKVEDGVVPTIAQLELVDLLRGEHLVKVRVRVRVRAGVRLRVRAGARLRLRVRAGARLRLRVRVRVGVRVGASTSVQPWLEL